MNIIIDDYEWVNIVSVIEDLINDVIAEPDDRFDAEDYADDIISKLGINRENNE